MNNLYKFKGLLELLGKLNLSEDEWKILIPINSINVERNKTHDTIK